MPSTSSATDPRGEAGAAALEFALVFPVFFLILYGMLHYGIVFVVSYGMTSAANDAARAAIQVSPEEEDYASLVVTRARAAAVARLDWLNSAQKAIVLGTGGERVVVSLQSDATLGAVVEIGISYPDYATQPILPVVTLPGLGAIPPVPEQLSARAVLQL